MDAGAVSLTTYLPPDSVMSYPETHVQQFNVHPMDLIASYIETLGFSGKRIGYESDTYFFSPKAFHCLQTGVKNATWVDADRLVNWCRLEKSDTEINVMRHATTTAHPMWTDEPFIAGQTVALELGGTRKRYNAGLARTVQLGHGPKAVFETASAVQEGLDAVLNTLKPGVEAGDAHRAWQTVLNKHGLVKDSRIGYSIGVGYSPDWGEHTVSIRSDDTTELKPNMTLHVMLGMWLDDWGMELSETVAITDSGVECLTRFNRDVHVVID